MAKLKAIDFNRFVTNRDCTYHGIDHADVVNRMICAMPNASAVMDLSGADITLKKYGLAHPLSFFGGMRSGENATLSSEAFYNRFSFIP